MDQQREKETPKYIDPFNLKCLSAKIGEFTLIFPGSSEVSLGKTINIKNVDRLKQPINGDLLTCLRRSILKQSEFDGVMVSGGIDSSLLAYIATEIKPDCKLLSAGFRDSEDLKYADILSSDLKSKLIKTELTDDKVEDIVSILKRLNLETYSIIIGITEYATLERAKNVGCKAVFSGLGSDELFFGFEKHKRISIEDLAALRTERLSQLYRLGVLRAKSIAKFLRIEVLFPYLDEGVLNYALTRDINELITDDYNKSLLRRAGKELGMNPILLERKKKAMQYGSGVVKILSRLAKKHKNKNIGEYIKDI